MMTLSDINSTFFVDLDDGVFVVINCVCGTEDPLYLEVGRNQYESGTCTCGRKYTGEMHFYYSARTEDYVYLEEETDR